MLGVIQTNRLIFLIWLVITLVLLTCVSFCIFGDFHTFLIGRINWGNLVQINITLVMLHILQRRMLTLTLHNSEQVFAMQTRLVSVDHACSNAWLM